MSQKRGQTKEYKDGMKMLKRRYAEWKQKRCLDERLELEEYLIDEPLALDLENDGSILGRLTH